MKAKFLLVFLFAILFQVNIPSSAREMKSLRRIELSCKTQAQHRSIPITPVAFIEDALVTIDLLSTVPTATVVVKDAEGKVVYSSTEWKYSFLRKYFPENLNWKIETLESSVTRGLT